jgi:cytochrome c
MHAVGGVKSHEAAGLAWRAGALAATLLALGLPFLGTQAVAQTAGPAAAPAREWLTPPPGDVQRGMALYQARCTACHAIDSNRTGPAHRGVVGRRVGSLAGYKYSDELAQSRLRWTPQTLNTWLEDPEELVPGQRMGFQVENAQERADLIAYLATLK